MSLLFSFSYSSCSGYTFINALKLKKKNSAGVGCLLIWASIYMEYNPYTVDFYARLLVDTANACPRTEYYLVGGVQMLHISGDCPEKHLVEHWFHTFCELLAESPYYVVPQNVHEACATLCMFSKPSHVIWNRLQAVLRLH